MKDTIYRQDAIDAMMQLQNEDIEAYGCRIPEGFDGDRAVMALRELPSAESEIIRCKDCKYWNPDFMECEGFGNWFGLKDEWNENGFCYKAERINDE